MKYRKKPIVVDAEQFFPDVLPWPEGVVEYEPGSTISGPYVIDTLEGPSIVSKGDWIITGIEGEKYPCKPDIFEATYEEVKP